MTPTQVAGLSEEQARAYFIRIRFAKWGGQPTCERCKCSAVYTFKTRPVYKCKQCDRQFSATSGTPWQYRKLPFLKLMGIIAAFAHGANGRSALDLCEDLRVQYKTVMVWLHKIRKEIAERAKEITLSGEVEFDGSYYNGHIRPKNQRLERKDHRRIFYKADNRSICVVAARERGGDIRTWVAKSEGDARMAIRDALAPDAVLFADEYKGWNWFRTHHRLFTINHSQAYYTPEACTNAVESYFGALRTAETIHGHISGQYLDLYAAAVGWRLSRKGKPKAWPLSDAMAAMSRPGKSELAGYFQGRKRSLALCQPDGTTKAWRPPSKQARAELRLKTAEGGEDALGASRVPSRQARWIEGFKFSRASEFLDDPSQVPNGPGIYAIFSKDGGALLEEIGYQAPMAGAKWAHEDYTHLYGGRSYGLRDRLLHHLTGDVGSSNLRKTLLALAHAFKPTTLPALQGSAEIDETALSKWMRANTLVGFKTCGYVADMERAMLSATACPLNVVRPDPTAFAGALRLVRARFDEEVSALWPKPTNRPPVRRR